MNIESFVKILKYLVVFLSTVSGSMMYHEADKNEIVNSSQYATEQLAKAFIDQAENLKGDMCYQERQELDHLLTLTAECASVVVALNQMCTKGDMM